jgi:hypothetical protein
VQQEGGNRDPLFFWDFYSVPTGPVWQRDHVIAVGDLAALVGRFGSNRNPPPTKIEALAEALTTPPLPPAYHTSYDRTPLGDFAGPPDGAVTVQDISLNVAQFGTACANS